MSSDEEEDKDPDYNPLKKQTISREQSVNKSTKQLVAKMSDHVKVKKEKEKMPDNESKQQLPLDVKKPKKHKEKDRDRERERERVPDQPKDRDRDREKNNKEKDRRQSVDKYDKPKKEKKFVLDMSLDSKSLLTFKMNPTADNGVPDRIVTDYSAESIKK